MAARAIMGLARTGAAGSNGSGDFVIAFSSSSDVRLRQQTTANRSLPRNLKSLSNDSMSPLFLAVIEATEEAIYNSLFKATTTTGKDTPSMRFRWIGPSKYFDDMVQSRTSRPITTSSRWSNLFLLTGKVFDTRDGPV